MDEHLAKYGEFPARVSASGEMLPEPQQKKPPTVLLGRPLPQGGCRGEAARTIWQVPGAESNLVAKLSHDSLEKALSDQRVIRVRKSWSECIKAKGFASPPLDMRVPDKRWNLNNPKISREEIRAAKVDVQCKYQVNLLGVTFAVESEYQNAEIEANSEALIELKRNRDKQLQRIRELLKKHGD
ncbi:hypothetical protein ACH35V_07015 [Actinomadura sp. 1N219]|uniref:hypothetical protein n=1 Tax=Actinomadura sp. 1N219 TaxID=3375152 RepID=UPI0037B56FA7